MFLLRVLLGIILINKPLSGSSTKDFTSESPAAVQDQTAHQRHWNFWKEKLGVPYFSNATETTVLATIGHTTYLHCLVGNLGDRQVSWIRRRDLRILSIGKIRYTQDTRFTPLHDEGNDVWALKIQESRLTDAGLYECQVSYHDDVEKKLKKPISLVVLDSYAMIDGSEERHVKAGSRLHLVCRVHDSSGPPNYVYWYRDDNVINYSGRKGIHIVTGDAIPKDYDKNEDLLDEDRNLTTTVASVTGIHNGTFSQHPLAESQSKEQKKQARPKKGRKPRIRPLIVSMLEIQMVMPDDAGIYTCAPSNARNHSVVVHVIQGENLAMQRENEGNTNTVTLGVSVSSNNSNSLRTIHHIWAILLLTALCGYSLR